MTGRPSRLSGIIPGRLSGIFWWLVPQDLPEDSWRYRQYLDMLSRGESLEPDPGLVGDRQYIHGCILDYYGSFKGLRVLGAGCGTGRIEAWLAEEGCEVVCMDSLVEALQISGIHGLRANTEQSLVLGDIRRMPLKDRTFDLIYSGGVVEHFEDTTETLREYLRVLKPNGVAILSVPNLVGFNAMFGLKPLTEVILGAKRRGSYIEQDFSAGRFKLAMKEAGFRCLDIRPTFLNTFEYFPFRYARAGLSLLGLFGPLCRLLECFGRRFPGVAFGYSFMIATAQRPRELKSGL
jgi:2-polyprenyl-3-methyl-5-hydroxy-6-metoxy-1,4-benzoquinol methylase